MSTATVASLKMKKSTAGKVKAVLKAVFITPFRSCFRDEDGLDHHDTFEVTKIPDDVVSNLRKSTETDSKSNKSMEVTTNPRNSEDIPESDHDEVVVEEPQTFGNQQDSYTSNRGNGNSEPVENVAVNLRRRYRFETTTSDGSGEIGLDILSDAARERLRIQITDLFKSTNVSDWKDVCDGVKKVDDCGMTKDADYVMFNKERFAKRERPSYTIKREEPKEFFMGRPIDIMSKPGQWREEMRKLRA